MKILSIVIAGTILITIGFILNIEPTSTEQIMEEQETLEKEQKATTILVNGVALDVEIADTRERQIQGLSGRESLGENSGMLFVYEEPGLPGIWMKDMNFPIDIVWITSEKRIVSTSKDIDPSTYPTTFKSH